MDEPQGAPVAPQMTGDRPGPVNDTSKLLAALSYPLWFPVGLIAILIDPYKGEKFVKFHAWQGMALGGIAWLISMVGAPLFGLGLIVGVAALVYQIFLAIKAWGGEYVEVPLIYGLIKGLAGE